jgi:zinc transport system substrate-binding protein
MRLRSVPVLVGAVAVVALAGCGDDSAASASGVTIQTSFYPLQFVAERVAGEHAAVENLTSPGGEPHDLELSPRQIGSMVDADLVVYLAGFQPAVDEAVDQSAADHALDVADAVELLEGHEHEHEHEGETEEEHSEHEGETEFDPHVWLDPQNMVAIADAVAERLADVDEANADDYRTNADALIEELTTLDAAYETGLGQCERDLIVVSHEAYGYLAHRYGLEQVGVSGLDPESEPSPQRIAEVQDIVRDAGVTTIFYERLVSPAVAESMADDLDITAAVLDPIEGLSDETESETYLTLMEQNLEALRTANDCA